MIPPPESDGETPSTDLRLRRTRKALRDGLLTLLRSKPLEDITARDIATESLVGYNTFFRHYASKAELVDDIVQEEIANLLAQTLPAVINADTRKACEHLCEYVYERRDLWGILLHRGAVSALRQTFIRYVIEHNIRTPEHHWLPMDLGALVGVGTTIDILSWWLAKPHEYTARQVAEYIDRLAVIPAVGGAASTVPAPAQKKQKSGLVSHKQKTP